MSKIKKNLFTFYSLTFISLLLLLSSTISFNHSLVKTTFAVEDGKSGEKYTSIIQKIRNLLEQLSNAYKTGDHQKANQLAMTAYLDNYEHLEIPLEITGNGDLMREIEFMMSVDLRNVIKEKMPQQEIDKLIDDINTKLSEVSIILDQ
jgi:hypothetical protein